MRRGEQTLGAGQSLVLTAARTQRRIHKETPMRKVPPGRGCRSGKIKYLSRNSARKAAHAIQHITGRMVPYRCQRCGYYHIGHET